MQCNCIEFIAAARCTVMQLRLDQTMRNFIFVDLEILFVVIQMGVARMKKSRLVYLLDLFGGRGEEGSAIWCV